MYTAMNFTSDMQSISTINDPKKSLNQLKRLDRKVKETIESFGFKSGKPYSQKESNTIVVHYPVVVDTTDSDEIWNKIYREVSSEFDKIVENANLDDIWAWEGMEISKKSPKDTIDMMVYLK
jgi:hypothetical protein